MKKLVSLFAGAGGLDLGLEEAGFTTVAANEINPEACETLRKNKELVNLGPVETETFIQEAHQQKSYRKYDTDFLDRLKLMPKKKVLQQAKVVEGDIREVASSDLYDKGDLYLVAGGPPCQPFSKAGKQRSLDCTKNGDLFYEFVRIVKELNPRWFLFENVKGITFTRTDVLYYKCDNCHSFYIAPFKERQDWKKESIARINCENCLSHNVTPFVKNEKGGSLKIIINEFEKAGYKCYSKVLNAADYGAPQSRERLIIVGSRDGLRFSWPKPTHENPKSKSIQQSFFEDSLPGWVSMYDALWSNGHWKYGDLDKDKAVLWVKNVVRPHDEPVTWSLDRISPTIGAHQGAKLAIAPKGVPEKQIFRQQWHSIGRRQSDTPPVPVLHEYLSDEELLKLQTFPAWWYLHGTRMQRAFQVGNAVPPILAKAIGKSIIESENQNQTYDSQSIYRRRVQASS